MDVKPTKLCGGLTLKNEQNTKKCFMCNFFFDVFHIYTQWEIEIPLSS